MATNDYTAGATRHRWPGSLQAIEDVLIFNLNTNAVNQGAAGVAECIPIKAGMEVLSVVVEVVTEEGGTLTVDVGDGADPDGYIDGLDGDDAGFKFYTPLSGSVAWNPSLIADGNEEVKAITVTGAKLGDFVEVSFSLDLEDLSLSGQIAGANTVDAILENNTGGNITLSAGTAKALVRSGTELYSVKGGKFYAADDTIDMVFNDAADAAVFKIMARVIDWGLGSSMP